MSKELPMQTKYVVAGALSLCLLLPALTLAAPEDTAADPNGPMQALTATLKSVTGKSVQYSADGGKTWLPGAVDIKLYKDAIVRTGFASTCEVSFRGNTIIKISALSSVRIADYLGRDDAEVVRANLQYGALRCGVEKGRVKSDTQITTPVAALAIRGTITKVEFDRGTNLCNLGVLTGRANASTRKGRRYVLDGGMKTDSQLSRHLQTAIFGRSVFITGNRAIGDFSDIEIARVTEVVGAFDLLGGQGGPGGPDRDRSIFFGGPHGDDDCSDCPDDGECDPGPSQ